MEPKSEKKEFDRFDKIGPTALVVAYRRSLSDIPLAKDIYNILADQGQSVDDDLLRPDLAPEIEARYKIVDRYLDRTGMKQVLEIASGLSPRGLNKTADPETHYVELDVPKMASVKLDLIDNLVGSGAVELRTNLKVLEGNALDLANLETAVSGFDHNRPIAVINEGLMRYLTMPERAQLARNIHTLLSKYGGVWITPDISLMRILENENKKDAKHLEKISNLTGANIVANRFEDVGHAKEFFEHLGFNVESHSWLEVIDEISSAQAAGANQEEVEENLGFPALFIMTPNT